MTDFEESPKCNRNPILESRNYPGSGTVERSLVGAENHKDLSQFEECLEICVK